MTTLSLQAPVEEARTFADLLGQLGNVPPDRILLKPAPGHAAEQDVIDLYNRERRLCELVDGTLVEKAMGLRESMLAGALIAMLRAFVLPRNLGIVTGEAGMVRLMAGLIRIPDVAFVSWSRLPGGVVPQDPVPDLAPDLAIEVLSPSNTRAEMDRKRREYFAAGVRLVWQIDPENRTVAAYTDPDRSTQVDAGGTLDGGPVLPGFTVPLGELFAELDRQAPQQA